MEMHKKYISNQEVEIIQLLHELSLDDCTLIYSVEGNMLVEYKGSHISRSKWDICKLYEEILLPFRNIKAEHFTPGFYCHMNADISPRENDYRLYLVKELGEILGLADGKMGTTLKYDVYCYVREAVEGLINDDIEINQFCLLHGDLYNGNILMHNGRYSMIDFEYIRFGPPQLEWAFLLFWDTLTEIDENKRNIFLAKIVEDIKTLREKKLVSITDIRLVLEIFLPAIVATALHFFDEGRFGESAMIKNGMTNFWNNEYIMIKEEL